MKRHLVAWQSLILWCTASCVFTIGCLALIGWWTDNIRLLHLNIHWVPMQFNTAVCYVCGGLSLFFILFSKKALAITMACIIFIFSGLTLIEYLFKVNIGIDQLLWKYDLSYLMEFPGRIAPNTATCLLLSSICLIFTAQSYRYLCSVITQMLSGIVISFTATVIFGYITGYNSVIHWSNFTGMALSTAIASLILNLGIFHYHFAYALNQKRFFYGPILGTLCFTTASLLTFWQANKAEHYVAVQTLTQHSVYYVAHDLESSIQNNNKVLRRIALRWGTLNDYPQTLWDIDTQSCLQDLNGLMSISWYNQDLQLQQSAAQESHVVHNDANTLSMLLQMMTQIKSLKKSQPIEHIVLNKTLFLLFPIFRSNSTFLGVLLAEVKLPIFIEKSIPHFLLNYYNLEIFDGTTLLYTSTSSHSPSITDGVSVQLHSPFIQLQITLFPTQATLSLIETTAPIFILILGCIVSLFMVLAVLLAQLTLRSKKILMTVLKEKEEAIAYRQAILNSSNYSIISTDISGTIVSFNHAAERMLLWKAEEMIGKQTPAVFHDTEEILKRAQELSNELHQHISPGIDVFLITARQGLADEREWTYIRRDGSRFPIRLSVTAVITSDGTPIGFVGIAYDLTELKELDRMKNELIAITSHELRSPLTTIKGSLDLLASHETLSEKHATLIKIARNNCERLINLTQDILDTQKIAAGKMSFHFTQVSLSTLLKKSITLNQALAYHHQISLEEPPDTPDYLLHADEDRLLQVMTNLISNAIKFSPQGTRVSFIISTHDGYVRIGVKDQGSGISKEFQPMMFQKFSKTSHSPQGIGLGLSICKAIIEAHQGIMGFDTSSQGSVVWFELPLQNQPTLNTT